MPSFKGMLMISG